jgi:hypothetical protein
VSTPSRLVTIAPVQSPDPDTPAGVWRPAGWADLLVGCAPVERADEWTRWQLAETPALAVAWMDLASDTVVTTLATGLRVAATTQAEAAGDSRRRPLWAVATAIVDAATDDGTPGWVPEQLRMVARGTQWTVRLECGYSPPPSWHSGICPD